MVVLSSGGDVQGADASALQALTDRLGAEVVHLDPETLLRYSADRGPVTQPALPIAVILASGIEDVRETLRWASTQGVSVVPRGAGTGVSGGAHAVERCVVLSLERMRRILEVNGAAQLARVEPGVITRDLDDALRVHGLMFAPDPASSSISTVGGNIATNAGGLRCVKYGVTRDSVLGLTSCLRTATFCEPAATP